MSQGTTKTRERLRSNKYVLTLHNISYLYLRNRKHVLCFYRVIETRVEEREMLWENEPQASVSTAFSSSPKLSRVFL